MEIYLVRHTTPNIAKGVCYGQANVDVTETFRNEVASTREILPADAIGFSSPLIRCAKMADNILGEYKTDGRLKKWPLVNGRKRNGRI